ncbi:unnamed protein product [Prunus armeniaca]
MPDLDHGGARGLSGSCAEGGSSGVPAGDGAGADEEGCAVAKTGVALVGAGAKGAGAERWVAAVGADASVMTRAGDGEVGVARSAGTRERIGDEFKLAAIGLDSSTWADCVGAKWAPNVAVAQYLDERHQAHRVGLNL